MRKWLPLVAICLGTFMLLIDVTIVNVALPDMAVDLSTSFSSLQWVIDIYALVLAALLLGAGSISDIIGRRLVYIAGLLLFALASLASGLAPNATFLIVARGVQGVGAAAMFATTVALINASYTGKDRGVAYGVWGAVSGAAAATGPIVGGLLTDTLSWRWIFFVNLPVSVAAIALSLMVLDGSRGEHRARIDLPGMFAFTASASLITYGFIRAGSDGWLTGTTLGLIGGGVLALVLFIIVELRTPQPLLDLGLFSDRRFVGVMIAALFLSLTAFSYLAYSSIWLQSVIGLSPIQAGLVFLPLSLAAFTVSASIGRVLHSANPRWLIGFGLLLIGFGGLAQAFLKADSSWPSLLFGLLLVGIGVGLVNPTMASAVMSAVPMQRGGMAAGAMNTARQLGFAFGIALLGTIFQSRIAHEFSGHAIPGGGDIAAAVSGGQAQAVMGAAPAARRDELSQLVHQAFASGLNTIFIVAGVLALAAGAAVLVLLRPAAQPASDSAFGTPAGIVPAGVPKASGG
ncbi:EmrB/QacA subfamily drug resistance transporter [Jatrophihabitans sp. GAS493]|uniref:MFS transporter n=1 Tax=Jatrophihabitans sp. GAS493 TaxID=1907575 RepID=UPI000BB67D7C|nr:MFS transporter [Jatrophihabitans sp. GAS493]SOD70925.1 EmrB/QacA subfamily drug resistance transporter [Jatrophihabitans sp. GAS493]